MAKQKVVTEMSNEQVAYYARELMSSSNPIEEKLGTALWEAIYAVRNRVDSALLTVNRLKGVSLEQDEIIDQIRAKLDTKYAMPEAPSTATDGAKVVAVYKEYRITASGKKFKIYKPEGGSLIYLKFASIEECREVIDETLAYNAHFEQMKADATA